MTVIWDTYNEACPGYFLDYFEPIPNIEFLPKNEKKLKIDYEGCSAYSEFDPKKVFIYKELKLLPHLQQRIMEKVNKLENNYIAVHIRRTDHIDLAKKNKVYTTDQDFYDFIDKNLENHCYLYIATDNRETQNIFIKKYGPEVPIIKMIEKSNKKRQTTLEDSIIDLYMCIHAQKFKGSGWSSFSDFIYQFREK